MHWGSLVRTVDEHALLSARISFCRLADLEQEAPCADTRTRKKEKSHKSLGCVSPLIGQTVCRHELRCSLLPPLSVSICLLFAFLRSLVRVVDR